MKIFVCQYLNGAQSNSHSLCGDQFAGLLSVVLDDVYGLRAETTKLLNPRGKGGAIDGIVDKQGRLDAAVAKRDEKIGLFLAAM